MRDVFPLLVALVLLVHPNAVCAVPPRYAITSFLRPVNPTGSVYGDTITSDGQMLGSGNIVNSTTSTPFIYSAGAGYQTFGTFGGPNGSLSARNANGVIVGSAMDSNNNYQGFFYNGTMILLDNLPGGQQSFARRLNSGGTIVGISVNASSQNTPFYWTSAGGMTAVPLGSFATGRSNDVNDSGIIAGTAVQGNGLSRAFRYNIASNIMQVLPTLGTGSSDASSITPDGLVYGYSQRSGLPPAGGSKAVRWGADNIIFELGSLPGYPNGWVRDGLDFGGLYGGFAVGEGYGMGQIAVLWDGVGGAFNLNTLLASPIPDHYFLLDTAVDINQSGQILAQGYYDNERVSVVLTPVPAPAPAVGLLVASALLAGRRRRWASSLVVLSACTCSAVAQTPPRYDIAAILRPLTPGGQVDGRVTATGDVVGYFDEQTAVTGFVYSHTNGVQTIGTFGGASSTVQGQNASGVLVGSAMDSAQQMRAFRTVAGQITQLTGVPGVRSFAHRINTHGSIVGESVDGAGASFPFVWTPSSAVANPVPLGGFVRGYAFDINDSGIIAGTAYEAGGRAQAYRYDSNTGSMLLLPSNGTPNRNSIAYAVTDGGLVYGSAQRTGTSLPYFQPARWSADGTLFAMDTLAGHSNAYVTSGLDAGGPYSLLAVGYSTFDVATLWDGFGHVYRLTDLMTVPIDSFAFESATAINSSGQISVRGYWNNESVLFLLNPIPAPAPAIALLLRSSVLVGTRRARRVAGNQMDWSEKAVSNAQWHQR